MGRDYQKGSAVVRREVFAELHAGEEVALTEKWEHQDISNGFHPDNSLLVFFTGW